MLPICLALRESKSRSDGESPQVLRVISFINSIAGTLAASLNNVFLSEYLTYNDNFVALFCVHASTLSIMNSCVYCVFWVIC